MSIQVLFFVLTLAARITVDAMKIIDSNIAFKPNLTTRVCRIGFFLRSVRKSAKIVKNNNIFRRLQVSMYVPCWPSNSTYSAPYHSCCFVSFVLSAKKLFSFAGGASETRVSNNLSFRCSWRSTFARNPTKKNANYNFLIILYFAQTPGG